VGPQPARDPVLVDFGLAGRKIRPGCATGNYGAPEIWGAFGDATNHSPLPADVYAYGCVAYEMLTGRMLFNAPSPIALIANHFAHDGRPEGIEALASDPELAPLADLLETALRHEPPNRATILDLKRELGRLRSWYESAPWPLGAVL
jgi:serine/threonine protein kinase